MRTVISDLEAMKALASSLVTQWSAGTVVFLYGPLGVGKTTFVRFVVESLGHDKAVRSPTFNLLQTFETQPPVLHADLYRLASPEGTGLEDYLDDHLCLIEWPERADGWIDPATVWHLRFDFVPGGEDRTVEITPRLS